MGFNSGRVHRLTHSGKRRQRSRRSVFAYKELLSSARADGLINADVDKIFNYLMTSDFELVLTLLWHAHHVNRALGINDSATDAAYNNLRSALVRIVHNHHASYGALASHVEAIYRFMMRFKTIVSLNYDLIVYWTMLAANDALGPWFKDAFRNGEYVSNWSF